jgi:hypothetical protein
MSRNGRRSGGSAGRGGGGFGNNKPLENCVSEHISDPKLAEVVETFTYNLGLSGYSPAAPDALRRPARDAQDWLHQLVDALSSQRADRANFDAMVDASFQIVQAVRAAQTAKDTIDWSQLPATPADLLQTFRSAERVTNANGVGPGSLLSLSVRGIGGAHGSGGTPRARELEKHAGTPSSNVSSVVREDPLQLLATQLASCAPSVREYATVLQNINRQDIPQRLTADAKTLVESAAKHARLNPPQVAVASYRAWTAHRAALVLMDAVDLRRDSWILDPLYTEDAAARTWKLMKNFTRTKAGGRSPNSPEPRLPIGSSAGSPGQAPATPTIITTAALPSVFTTFREAIAAITKTLQRELVSVKCYREALTGDPQLSGLWNLQTEDMVAAAEVHVRRLDPPAIPRYERWTLDRAALLLVGLAHPRSHPWILQPEMSPSASAMTGHLMDAAESLGPLPPGCRSVADAFARVTKVLQGVLIAPDEVAAALVGAFPGYLLPLAARDMLRDAEAHLRAGRVTGITIRGYENWTVDRAALLLLGVASPHAHPWIMLPDSTSDALDRTQTLVRHAESASEQALILSLPQTQPQLQSVAATQSFATLGEDALSHSYAARAAVARPAPGMVVESRELEQSNLRLPRGCKSVAAALTIIERALAGDGQLAVNVALYRAALRRAPELHGFDMNEATRDMIAAAESEAGRHINRVTYELWTLDRALLLLIGLAVPARHRWIMDPRDSHEKAEATVAMMTAARAMTTAAVEDDGRQLLSMPLSLTLPRDAYDPERVQRVRDAATREEYERNARAEGSWEWFEREIQRELPKDARQWVDRCAAMRRALPRFEERQEHLYWVKRELLGMKRFEDCDWAKKPAVPRPPPPSRLPTKLPMELHGRAAYHTASASTKPKLPAKFITSGPTAKAAPPAVAPRKTVAEVRRQDAPDSDAIWQAAQYEKWRKSRSRSEARSATPAESIAVLTTTSSNDAAADDNDSDAKLLVPAAAESRLPNKRDLSRAPSERPVKASRAEMAGNVPQPTPTSAVVPCTRRSQPRTRQVVDAAQETLLCSVADRQAERRAKRDKDVRGWALAMEAAAGRLRLMPPEMQELLRFMAPVLMPAYRALAVGDLVRVTIDDKRNRCLITGSGIVVLAPRNDRVTVLYAEIDGDELDEPVYLNVPANRNFRLLDMRYVDLDECWVVSQQVDPYTGEYSVAQSTIDQSTEAKAEEERGATVLVKQETSGRDETALQGHQNIVVFHDSSVIAGDDTPQMSDRDADGDIVHDRREDVTTSLERDRGKLQPPVENQRDDGDEVRVTQHVSLGGTWSETADGRSVGTWSGNAATLDRAGVFTTAEQPCGDGHAHDDEEQNIAQNGQLGFDGSGSAGNKDDVCVPELGTAECLGTQAEALRDNDDEPLSAVTQDAQHQLPGSCVDGRAVE